MTDSYLDLAARVSRLEHIEKWRQEAEDARAERRQTVRREMLQVGAGVAIGLFVALLGSAALAQQGPPCAATHAEAVTLLADRYGEVPTGYGLARDQGSVIEVFVSQAGSWTIVRVLPDGKTCMVLDGYGWVFVETPWPSQGEEG